MKGIAVGNSSFAWSAGSVFGDRFASLAPYMEAILTAFREASMNKTGRFRLPT